ncbi:putative HNHc nuclease [Weissella minor]|nr:putative HNHc nuclease [Weissella minor]
MIGVQGNIVRFAAENPEELATLSLYTHEDYPEAVLNIPDNRKISAVQRKKAYALLHDMAKQIGQDESSFKDAMKKLFVEETGEETFSFSDTDMTTARYFISFLLDYALKWHIPLSKSALSYQDDLDMYMYQSLKYRSCVLCGKHADVHHVDAIGNNQFRALADHREKRLVALCRIHHQEAGNMGWPTFSDLYHVKGIYLEPKMLNQLGIMTYERMKQIDDKQNRTGWKTN